MKASEIQLQAVSASLYRRICALQQEVSHAQKANEESHRQLVDLQTQKHALLEESKRQQQDHRCEVSDLKKRLRETEEQWKQEMQETSEQISERDKKICSLEASFNRAQYSKEQEWEGRLSSARDGFTSRLREATSQNEDLTARLEVLSREKAGMCDIVVMGMDARLTILQAAFSVPCLFMGLVSEHRKMQAEMSRKHKKVEGELATTLKKALQADSSKAALEEIVAGLKSQLCSQKAVIDAQDASTEDLHREIAGFKTRIAELQVQVEEAKEEAHGHALEAAKAMEAMEAAQAEHGASVESLLKSWTLEKAAITKLASDTARRARDRAKREALRWDQKLRKMKAEAKKLSEERAALHARVYDLEEQVLNGELNRGPEKLVPGPSSAGDANHACAPEIDTARLLEEMAAVRARQEAYLQRVNA
ncbi:unnamed protein product [Ostreobium quekettii]|uniref:Uncharacterized protein n=1 Tax=Ostreobium quekettii TaxID=121088 RepID=A0A8S1IQW1_9CHLO|nr:unnamed protein product [Ostreobium quekettii]|eukprot:evm.model.scf_958.2 EVM.evm.TU.scf_958.2   scf_958:26668-31940(-)